MTGKPKSKRSRRKFWGRKGVIYGIPYDSGLEKAFIQNCHQLGIKVRRSPDVVAYQGSDGKFRKYYPDFYLPDINFTIEVKGTWALRTDHANVKAKTFAALKFFKGRYTVFTEKELRSTMLAEIYAREMNHEAT